MSKTDNISAVVYTKLKEDVNGVKDAVSKLQERVNTIEEQPSSGNSPTYTIVNSDIIYDAVRIGFRSVLNERDKQGVGSSSFDENQVQSQMSSALETALESHFQKTLKRKPGDSIATLDELTKSISDAFNLYADAAAKWADSNDKLSNIISDYHKDLKTFQDFEKKKADSNNIIYNFSMWKHTKTYMEYIFQSDFWFDARVLILSVILVLSLLVSCLAFSRYEEMTDYAIKYELLYRDFGQTRIIGNQMRYLDSLFVNKEQNAEKIERLRKIPIR